MVQKSKLITNLLIMLIILVVLNFIGVIVFLMTNGHLYQSPFQSEEQKRLKPFYNKITEGTNDLKLKYLDIDEDCLCLTLYMSGGREGIFEDSDITTFNQVIEQTISYLNDNLHDEITYSTIKFKFMRNNGHPPKSVTCILSKNIKKYFFDSFYDDRSVEMSQFYMFENVKRIDYEFFPQEVPDNLGIDQLSNLQKLDIHIENEEDRQLIMDKISDMITYKVNIILDK